jgi:hypothetical protein
MICSASLLRSAGQTVRAFLRESEKMLDKSILE